jgi:hypothetical protein
MTIGGYKKIVEEINKDLDKMLERKSICLDDEIEVSGTNIVQDLMIVQIHGNNTIYGIKGEVK